MPESAASASSSSRLSGVPLLAGTMAIIVLFGKRLLPERNGATMPADFSRHAKTLVEQYGLASGVYQMRVRATLALCRASPRPPSTLPTFPASQLVAVQDGEPAAPLRRTCRWPRAITCCLRGDAEAAAAFAAQMHLAFRDEQAAGRGEETLFNRRSGLAEVVIPPRSGLIGQDRVSRHGDRKRRPDHPCRAARRRARSLRRPAKRRQAASCCRPATPCCCRARGKRSTCVSTIRTSSSSTRPNWCVARRCRWGRARARRSSSWSPWWCCSPPASFRLPSPACSPPARSSCRGS